MSLPGQGREAAGESFDEEGLYLDEEDIINEVPIDEEGRSSSPRRIVLISYCSRNLPDLEEDDNDGNDDDEEMDEVYAVAVSPTDVSLVASGGKDDKGFLWKIGSLDGVLELAGHSDTVCTVAFSSDGSLVASGDLDGHINVWNAVTRTFQGTLDGSVSGFEWLKWHPRDNLIIAGSEDCNVWMWNTDDNFIRNTFAGHSSTVTCGDFTPDGKLICTGSDDASLRIWDPRTAQSKHVIRGHGYHADGLTCLSITLDSQTVVSGSKDNSVHVVKINSGKKLYLTSTSCLQVVGSLVGHTSSVECVGISPRYNWVATGGMDQKLVIWDLTHQSRRCDIPCMVGFLKVCRIRMHGWEGAVRIWDTLSGHCARTFNGHANIVQSLAISADGNCIVSVSTDWSARVFDISMFK
ncbi:hypothetical protein EJB05_15563, partial [Eragrostis curvula]